MARETATEQGEAELRILDFKTTWSEFQMPSQTAPAKAKPRCVYSILKPHGQSSRSPVRLLLSEAKPRELRILDFKTTWSEDTKSDCSRQGEAEVCIFNFKTPWSELQKPSPIAAMQGEVELRILNFKTTWSEFQKPCQTAATRGKAELRICNLR